LCIRGEVRYNRVTSGGDDAVALNSAEAPTPGGNEPSRDIVIEDNLHLAVERGQNGGCPIALRGGDTIHVRRNNTYGGVRAGVLAMEDTGVAAREIFITDNRMYDSDGYATEMKSVRSGILARNTAYRPGQRPAFNVHGSLGGVTVGINKVIT
jgi:hypothetical protein